MFPTLSEAVTGTRLTVAAPFFNQWMAPIGLILLFLTGVGPLLALAEVHARSNLRESVHVAGARRRRHRRRAAGARASRSGRRVCASRCARFVVGTVVQEFWRGANVRRQNTGTDFFTALVGLVGRNKRRYGGYIVHLGIVLMFLGFAGGAYKIDSRWRSSSASRSPSAATRSATTASR